MARSREAKNGRGRVGWDQAAALEALVWARGGEQLELLGEPPARALRLVGAGPVPDDAEEGEARPGGRPPGAQNVAPEGWRRYLVARHGSVIEGAVITGTSPVVSIAAELLQAYELLWRATYGTKPPQLRAAQMLELISRAASLREGARKIAAPYQHSQAPQPVKDLPPERRVAIAMFSGAPTTDGKVAASDEAAAVLVLAQMLRVDPARIVNPLKSHDIDASDAVDLNAADLNAARREEA